MRRPWNFNGQVTGLGLSDFLLGRVATMELGGTEAPTRAVVHRHVRPGFLARDKPSDAQPRLRWSRSSASIYRAGSGFRSGAGRTSGTASGAASSSTHRPASYAGDPGFPPGRSGINRQWLNFARAGLAWDVTGDGARRSARYGAWLRLSGQRFLFPPVVGAALGNRIRFDFPPGGFDDPYGHVGGDPHPIETNRNTIYPLGGAFGVMALDINSPRVQSWNVTVERQIGADWGVAVSYLGNYTDRLWDLYRSARRCSWGSVRARSTALPFKCAAPRPIRTRGA